MVPSRRIHDTTPRAALHSLPFTQNTYGNPVGRVPIPISYKARRILRVREPGRVVARIVSRVTGAGGGTSGDCITSQGMGMDICVLPGTGTGKDPGINPSPHRPVRGFSNGYSG